jgi:hypothetical protein
LGIASYQIALRNRVIVFDAIAIGYGVEVGGRMLLEVCVAHGAAPGVLHAARLSMRLELD